MRKEYHKYHTIEFYHPTFQQYYISWPILFMSLISGGYYFKTFEVVHLLKEKCRSINTISRIARFESRA